MSRKGSENERELAKLFSKWWCPDGDGDTFWRVGGSGGRAKGRGRKGLDTYGQAGDLMATDPIGTPFTEMFTCEFKKGYAGTEANPFEAIDRIMPLKPTRMNFAGWIEQVEESRAQAKTPYWMVVFQRNRRKRMACMPAMVITGSSLFSAADRGSLKIAEACRMTFRVSGGEWYLSFFPLDELLQAMTPDMVREANRRRRNGL